jgi:hypothetical protein
VKDAGRGVGARTEKGQALMSEAELAVLGLGPWILDVLDRKSPVWGTECGKGAGSRSVPMNSWVPAERGGNDEARSRSQFPWYN